MIKVGDIQVTVTYKKVKRVTLKVTNGEVALVCPRGVKEEYLVGFVEKNAEWIRRMLDKKSGGPFMSKNFVDGDKITVLGQAYTLKCVQSDRNTVQVTNGEVQLFYKQKDYEKRDRIFRKWQVFALERILNESLKKWYDITGLDCSDIVIKDMKSRWGSCNILTKKIAFSIRLLSQKRACIDYVVLHELTHTVHKNHDKNFYGFIAKYMPDYKVVSKGLTMPIEK